MKFRIKPVEAMQYTTTNGGEVIKWAPNNIKEFTSDGGDGTPYKYLIVKNGIADQRAIQGDWVVKDHNWGLTVLSPDLFSRTYEPAQ